MDELMHAAQRHEAAAKRAMREAISQGRVAADAAMKERKVSEQTGEVLESLTGGSATVFFFPSK